MHGLRHENLNPFIGCLTEPSRPCIVTEYCSRGSLEDVLVQDVKLDWSFRLSLLTDLVRVIIIVIILIILINNKLIYQMYL